MKVGERVAAAIRSEEVLDIVGESSGDTLSTSDALERLRHARGFIFDMDGVLYRGGQKLAGVNDLFNALVLRERTIVLATNNSMASPATYATRLAAMGIEVAEANILTSGSATAAYLKEELPSGSGVYVIGMPALRDLIFGDGSFQPVQYGEGPVAAVVAGLDLQFTYEKLRHASAAIRGGARFVATNTDATLPTEDGLQPGAGSIIAAVATASGAAPVVVGKPEPLMLLEALRLFKLDAAETVMVGDRLDTDILAGSRANLLTALVLTGVSTREDLATSSILPDLVFSDLPAMLEMLIGNS
ncbi:MAG: HAD-IIA family hydrolase [Gemmatimonadota bacterium]|nr:HAD-IIA family hydrolase [Gemmatimonadota bacterium]